MRPPILRWKVIVALAAVVAVGVSLGSALRSPVRTPQNEARVSSVITLHAVPSKGGGWTGYAPLQTSTVAYFSGGKAKAVTASHMQREECKSLEHTLHALPKGASKSQLKTLFKQACPAHR